MKHSPNFTQRGGLVVSWCRLSPSGSGVDMVVQYSSGFIGVAEADYLFIIYLLEAIPV